MGRDFEPPPAEEFAALLTTGSLSIRDAIKVLLRACHVLGVRPVTLQTFVMAQLARMQRDPQAPPSAREQLRW